MRKFSASRGNLACRIVVVVRSSGRPKCYILSTNFPSLKLKRFSMYSHYSRNETYKLYKVDCMQVERKLFVHRMPSHCQTTKDMVFYVWDFYDIPPSAYQIINPNHIQYKANGCNFVTFVTYENKQSRKHSCAYICMQLPILVAARSKVSVCGHYPAGNAGPNPIGGMNAGLL